MWLQQQVVLLLRCHAAEQAQGQLQLPAGPEVLVRLRVLQACQPEEACRLTVLGQQQQQLLQDALPPSSKAAVQTCILLHLQTRCQPRQQQLLHH